jgi:hypothetical protein
MMLQGHLETLTIDIVLIPFALDQHDPGGELRSVLLYQSDLRIEPPGLWPDGTPVSTHARLTGPTLGAVVEDLDRLGLWRDAAIYYSERVLNPKSRPSVGKDYRTHEMLFPSCEITAAYFEGDYYTYIVATIPWGGRVATVLQALKGRIPKPPADGLIATYERFRPS